MSRITILTVSFWSVAFVELLVENLRAKARDPSGVRVLVVDNSGGADAALARLSQVEIWPYTPGERNGSRAHARALDFALPRVTSEYMLIVDPDVHVFCAGWDALCIGALEQRGAFAIGAPYPAWKVGKYHDFPSPPFCFFRTEELRGLGASFVPFGGTRAEDARAFALRQIGRGGGLLTRRRYEQSTLVRRYATWSERTLGVFGPDTGWRIAAAARERGLASVLFDAVLVGSPSFDAGSGAFQALARDYELYTFEGAPVLTHKYGTGAAPWRTERGADVGFWREAIARLERELGSATTAPVGSTKASG